MIIKFSQAHFEKVSVYRAETPSQQIAYIFHNRANEDMTFVSRYKAGKFLSQASVILVPAQETAKVYAPQKHLYYLWCGPPHERTPRRIVITNLPCTDLKTVEKPNYTDYYRCLEEFEEVLKPHVLGTVEYSARAYKKSSKKVKKGKTVVDVDVHRIMMAGGVDLFFVQNKNSEAVSVEFEGKSMIIEAHKVGHFSSAVLQFSIKFMYLRNPNLKSGRWILESDKFEYLGSSLYTDKDAFIRNRLWDLLRK
ncbi:hypothetical protein Unana1_08935 [Umbelopsis nana]